MKKIFIFTLILITLSVAEDKFSELKWYLDDALQSEYDPISFPDIINSKSVYQALKNYENGNYRRASVVFQDILNLNIQNGSVDNTAFLAAESYRILGMNTKAQNAYHFILEKYPKSDKCAPSLFRIFQYLYKIERYDIVDSIVPIFKRRYASHPLMNDIFYIGGKCKFKQQEYKKTTNLLFGIPRTSSRFFKAQFLAAISLVKMEELDKALLILGNLESSISNDVNFSSNVAALIGDIYLSRGNYDIALKFYSKIDKTSNKFSYSKVKIALAYFKKKRYSMAIKIAKDFIRNGKNRAHFFEMASILENSYRRTEKTLKLDKLQALVNKNNVRAILSFDIDEEIQILYELRREWIELKYSAEENQYTDLITESKKKLDKIDELIYSNRKLLTAFGIITDPNKEVAGLREKRYVSQLSIKIDSVATILDSLRKNQVNASRTNVVMPLSNMLQELKNEFSQISILYVNKGDATEGDVAEGYSFDMQAKYIDWAFNKYIQKKQEIKEYEKSDSKKRNSNSNIDSVKIDTIETKLSEKTTKKDEAADGRSNLPVRVFNLELENRALSTLRERLKLYIITFLKSSVKNSYTPQILFRLAELYYDAESEVFAEKLDIYEKAMELTGGSTPIEFPEYNLDGMLNAYNKILEEFPKNWIADDALYYRSQGYKKIGNIEVANEGFEKLVNEYPESEYYVQANMNIGNYYFTHPKVKNRTGYQLAEAAFKRVLYFRDHPQFVQAVYHLGWCYYMMDSYEEAISVFKYLVEEVDLDFGVSSNMDSDNDISNPLMREEAIDYIAISFDEQGQIDEARKFLELVGNIDYAAKVVMRIGELREEDLDYSAAVSIYKKVINEYSQSLLAPKAMLKLIKVLETSGASDAAMDERLNFFNKYNKGSNWYKNAFEKDSIYTKSNDSIVIATGLYLGDTYYRDAEKNSDLKIYKKAAHAYDQIISTYPNNPVAADARWNLAVILDTKLGVKKLAYQRYLEFSQLKNIDKAKKEQAALNAIAIAQSLLKASNDTTAGKMSIAAVKTVEAVENYIKLFPKGNSYTTVVMAMGAVYFNRKMYSKAIETYKLITDKGTAFKGYYDAGLFIAKSYFGQESWPQAIKRFAKVWRESSDEFQKNDAYKWLLQSEYFNSERFFINGDFKNAAISFYEIHTKYPGSKNSDVALFRSAESYEKMKKWADAAKVHTDLFDNYPGSPLAPDALFSGASDYEKVEDWKNAARLYELIVSNFLDHDKAKDALFNVGFCYDRLGSYEKMADANERYAKFFPGEKDVESMLLRSAVFYFNANKFDRAKKVYDNFVNRYPNKQKSIEALVMAGKCSLREKDTLDAKTYFNRAETLHKKLLTANGGDPFFAGEASFAIGKLKEKEFNNISLAVSGDDFKSAKVLKTAVLKEATLAYGNTIKYKSPRIFEAAYRIGQLYEHLSDSWLEQTIDNKDPMRVIVAKKNAYAISSLIIKKSFAPYATVVKLVAEAKKGLKKKSSKKTNVTAVVDTSSIDTVAVNLRQKNDSLLANMEQWGDSARIAIERVVLTSGRRQENTVKIMQNAPIPDEIKEQPLFLLTYKKQFFETMEPLRIKVRDNWLQLYDELKEMNISEPAESTCIESFAKSAYMIPHIYDEFVNEIEASIKALPKDLDPDEREDLQFNMEDILFEFQDNALFAYSDALGLLKNEGFEKSVWAGKIRERMAYLDPDTYGKEYFVKKEIYSDAMSIYNPQRVKYWNEPDPFAKGWQQVNDLGKAKGFPNKNTTYIWGEKSHKITYLWKNLFLNGTPLDGEIYYSTAGRYKIYLNGKLLTSSDTISTSKEMNVDTIKGLKTMLYGGDNIIGVAVHCPDTLNRKVAFAAYAIIDTSENFKSIALAPKVKLVAQTQNIKADSSENNMVQIKSSLPAALTDDSFAQKQKNIMGEYINRGEMRADIEKYNKMSKALYVDVNNEKVKIKSVNTRITEVDKDIKNILFEISVLKKRRSSLGVKK